MKNITWAGLTFARLYSKKAVDISKSPAVTGPLNYVLGQRIDARGSETFPLNAPATGKKDVQILPISNFFGKVRCQNS